MKNLIKPFFAIALAAVTFTSCMKNDDPIDNTEEYRKIEQRVDSVLTKQKVAIEAYVQNELLNAVEDTVTINLTYLDKVVKRGIWYQIDAEPTDDSFEYEVTGSGYTIPNAKVKYSVKNLEGTTTYKEDTAGSSYVLGGSNANPSVFNQVWQSSFYPYSIDYNGNTMYPKGLTKEGLKKGSKITVVTPSIWAFDTQNVGDIPANTPLVYEFEVVEIN